VEFGEECIASIAVPRGGHECIAGGGEVLRTSRASDIDRTIAPHGDIGDCRATVRITGASEQGDEFHPGAHWVQLRDHQLLAALYMPIVGPWADRKLGVMGDPRQISRTVHVDEDSGGEEIQIRRIEHASGHWVKMLQEILAYRRRRQVCARSGVSDTVPDGIQRSVTSPWHSFPSGDSPAAR